jgi:REP-associated tyrosine transposase
MHYRRNRTPGACYFFTVNLANRKQTLLVDHYDVLRAVIHTVQQRHPFVIDAMVVLPEHLHAVWTLPEEAADYSTRWSLIKSAFSRRFDKIEPRSCSRMNKRERGIWQRRFWEHCIRDERDYVRHVDYIHYNPVKHGYVDSASDWRYSSIHRYIRLGLLDEDWGGRQQAHITGEYGE